MAAVQVACAPMKDLNTTLSSVKGLHLVHSKLGQILNLPTLSSRNRITHLVVPFALAIALLVAQALGASSNTLSSVRWIGSFMSAFAAMVFWSYLPVFVTIVLNGWSSPLSVAAKRLCIIVPCAVAALACALTVL